MHTRRKSVKAYENIWFLIRLSVRDPNSAANWIFRKIPAQSPPPSLSPRHFSVSQHYYFTIFNDVRVSVNNPTNEARENYTLFTSHSLFAKRIKSNVQKHLWIAKWFKLHRDLQNDSKTKAFEYNAFQICKYRIYFNSVIVYKHVKYYKAIHISYQMKTNRVH